MCAHRPTFVCKDTESHGPGCAVLWGTVGTLTVCAAVGILGGGLFGYWNERSSHC